MPLIKELAQQGVKLNVTALLTLKQVEGTAAALNPAVPSVVSVFAGRIADTGVDPMPIMRACVPLLEEAAQSRAALGASTREGRGEQPFQAEEVGCKIITVPNDSIAKAVKQVWHQISPKSPSTR